MLPPDEFWGDNTRLVACIEALLLMDKAGVLVPHGVGGYARTMLAAAAHRLAHPAPAPDVALIDVPHQECYSDGDGDTWFDGPDDAEFPQGRDRKDVGEGTGGEER